MFICLARPSLDDVALVPILHGLFGKSLISHQNEVERERMAPTGMLLPKSTFSRSMEYPFAVKELASLSGNQASPLRLALSS